MPVLKTDLGRHLLSELRKPLKLHLELVDAEAGADASPELERLRFMLAEARVVHDSGTDETLNDIFVLEKYVQFFGEYGYLWRNIATFQFSESWSSLQNAFDLIRLVRKFSNINVSTLENQLYALESAYPYKVFFSMGAVVERFECSICGKDIDSFECKHRKGELYRGQMAYGIARNIVRFDHLAMVEHPVDKRCVVTYANDAPQFGVVRYIGELLDSKKLLVSNFGSIAWGKRRIPNPNHTDLGRNQSCYCGSGRKFKKCCIDKAFTEQDHAQILPTHSIIERADA